MEIKNICDICGNYSSDELFILPIGDRPIKEETIMVNITGTKCNLCNRCKNCLAHNIETMKNLFHKN